MDDVGQEGQALERGQHCTRKEDEAVTVIRVVLADRPIEPLAVEVLG